jgi:hypothetical protein
VARAASFCITNPGWTLEEVSTPDARTPTCAVGAHRGFDLGAKVISISVEPAL